MTYPLPKLVVCLLNYGQKNGKDAESTALISHFIHSASHLLIIRFLLIQFIYFGQIGHLRFRFWLIPPPNVRNCRNGLEQFGPSMD
jgi:hypothetical protein